MSTMTPLLTIRANKHVLSTDTLKTVKIYGLILVGSMLTLFTKTIEQSTQWGVSIPSTFPMKKLLKSRNPALNIPRRHEAVASVGCQY